jgi:hypothetical protein
MKRACSMSKDQALVDPAIALNHDSASAQDTAGALLRTARQSQGLDIATLAALLKVPVHKLQALEQDKPELLADPVFARALAASMCRILQLEAGPVLHRLPRTGGSTRRFVPEPAKIRFHFGPVFRDQPFFWVWFCCLAHSC